MKMKIKIWLSIPKERTRERVINILLERIKGLITPRKTSQIMNASLVMRWDTLL